MQNFLFVICVTAMNMFIDFVLKFLFILLPIDEEIHI